MTRRATALVTSLSRLDADPRAHRQIAALRERHRVCTAGFSPSAFGELAHETLEAPTLAQALSPRHPRAAARALTSQAVSRAALLRHGRSASPREPASALVEMYYASPTWRRWTGQLVRLRADVVLVNDPLMLPVAFRLPGPPSVVFDAHEHATSQRADSLWWQALQRPLLRYVLSRYLPRVAGMTCVGPGIAERYARSSGVVGRLVTNAPAFADLEPGAVDPEAIRVVHFGVAHPQRRLDLTIEAVASLGERYWLDLYLVGREDRLAQVRAWAAPHPRVRVMDPVPMREIVRVANGYDVGVHLLPLDLVNHRLALPNKFFDYVQGRLAVAIGPSPEMARIAREWDFGLVADGFTAEALARAIGGAGVDRIRHCKWRAHEAARVLNAEASAAVIRDVVDEAVAAGGGVR